MCKQFSVLQGTIAILVLVGMMGLPGPLHAQEVGDEDGTTPAQSSSLFLPLVTQNDTGQAATDQAPPAEAQTPCPPRFLSEQAADAANPDCTSTVAVSVISAATLPANFQESVVFSGLTNPTSIRFPRDGRVFVAQKNGIVKVFASLTATTATTFVNLPAAVHDFWDRGLLGLALDPNFPTNPYVYVLYAYDAAIGGTAPKWGDGCPTPPGPTTDGCLISGRLSRLTADATGNAMVAGGEKVLINDWCQQFPSHSVGQLFFGPDGALYVSGGDGASFNNVDYGQSGNTYAGDQLNPCGDPPAGVGGVESPPTAEGGALRSQSLNRSAGPAVLGGTILRVDPATGLALSDNPLAGSSDLNARRIVAYGMRNPFRFTFRPGTNEIWVGDVGWATWEEIGRIPSPTAATVTNFGWPCYEGDNASSAQTQYKNANLTICNNLYSTAGSVTAPYYAYQHGVDVIAGEACQTASGSAITGLAFYNGDAYPSSYNGALFFADHSRNCIWVMPPGSNGLPDKTKVANFVIGAGNPVDLQVGPGGDLFYADMEGGAIRRIQYAGSGNQPPTAVIKASPTNGAAPLTVNFDGTASSDPDAGDGIAAYSWDLNGDGVFGDASTATASYTYNQAGSYTAGLKVTDKHGATGTSSVVISANNTPPTAVIDAPAGCSASAPCWAVGDAIAFSGHATDPQQGTLGAAALTWMVIVHHCATDLTACHTHQVQSYAGVASGTFTAPDHEYPSYLELKLTATDAGGLQNSASVLLYPRTVNLTMQSNPSGLQLTVNSAGQATPFNRTVIVGSSNSISAPTPQDLNGTRYAFQSWSDGGAQTHNIKAGTTGATYTATYVAVSADLQIEKTGTVSADRSTITYRLTVTNKGPAAAANVVVTDPQPAKVQFFSASSTIGSCSGTTTVTCALGTLNNGQSATVTITGRLDKRGGSVTNTASVSSGTPDPNTGNNSSTAQNKIR